MLKKISLKTFLFFALILSGTVLKAQGMKEAKDVTYAITDKGSVSDVQPYIDALNNSDMRYHRLKNTRNTIVFSTGVTVQLYSASELITAGQPLNISDYP